MQKVDARGYTGGYKCASLHILFRVQPSADHIKLHAHISANGAPMLFHNSYNTNNRACMMYGGGYSN